MKKIFHLSLLFTRYFFSWKRFLSMQLRTKNYISIIPNSNLPLGSVRGPDMDCEIADTDGDGDSDIMLAREFAPNKLLLDNGNGVFTDVYRKITQFNYESEDIAVADNNLFSGIYFVKMVVKDLNNIIKIVLNK